VCGGLVLGHFFGADKVLPVAIVVACFGGTIFSLVVWLHFGGLACIQYLLVRLLLLRSRRVPWYYARFLDYACERLLLRKVGGGYMFFHQLLQDYFAGVDVGLLEHSELRDC
jgi:hypothetical protein